MIRIPSDSRTALTHRLSVHLPETAFFFLPLPQYDLENTGFNRNPYDCRRTR